MPLHISETPHVLVPFEGRQAVWLEGADVREMKVAGTSYRQDHLSLAARGAELEQPIRGGAWLILQPSEHHEGNSVRVIILGALVGYMPREEAPRWSLAIAEAWQRYAVYTACHAMIVGGRVADGHKQFYGVRLLLPA